VKSISVTTPCFNEEENVEILYRRVRDEFAALKRYRYEHIFIDNCSTDATVAILKRLAAKDRNVKIICNTRNFGQIRSPMHAFSQARGDAILNIVADLQDPPELIPELVKAWEEGYAMAVCIRKASAEHPVMFRLRHFYYRLVNRLSSVETFENFTGFGLYDRRVIDQVMAFGDPYPYFRGMIADIGLPCKKIDFDQPKRIRGITKNNFYTLYDLAMLGIVNHSKVPLRLAAFTGFVGGALSFLVGFAYLVYKLLFWNTFSAGEAPIIIVLSFIGSLQLAFLGILGEYIGAIHTQLQRRPYAIERERVNFEYEPALPQRAEPLEVEA
jgi:glycosyltransferase involved in cell wall biosynthesis